LIGWPVESVFLRVYYVAEINFCSELLTGAIIYDGFKGLLISEDFTRVWGLIGFYHTLVRRSLRGLLLEVRSKLTLVACLMFVEEVASLGAILCC
jgi:hypothetical protein